jgi:hypothetical protein
LKYEYYAKWDALLYLRTQHVMYNGNVILTGYKDLSTDIWILPMTPDAIGSQEKLGTSQGHDSVSPRANKILLHHHVEHTTIAPACAALAQKQ